MQLVGEAERIETLTAKNNGYIKENKQNWNI